MPLRRRRLTGALAIATLATSTLALATLSTSSTAAPKPGPDDDDRFVDVQLLSFNDFHGNLEPPSGSSGRIVVDHHLDQDGKPADTTVNAGGVEYLATHLEQARAGHERSLTVAAGDIIGASPLLSAAFHDEPTIEAMNALDLDVTAVGNHEFDEGYRELQRMQHGGCIDDGEGRDNQNSCPDGSFDGASFDFLAANVKEQATGETILPAYSIEKVDGVRVGFIGMTLEDTPDIVTASGVAGLQFTDEVETANALVPELKAQKVEAIVVLLHQGGSPDRETWTDPNGVQHRVNPTYDYVCAGGGRLIPASSPILPIASALDPEIDMIVSGHTHQPYVCNVTDPAGQDRVVTSASSFGRLYTETNFTYDRRNRDIVRDSVVSDNQIVTRDVDRNAAQSALIGTYKTLVTPIASRVIGQITTDVTDNATPESALGDLIADAQLADPSVVVNGMEPVIAFMNPGGIRTDLTYANSSHGEPDGHVTFAEAFAVQPFNNYLVSMTLTGQDIYDLLAQQVTGTNAGFNKILQVSDGFSYRLGATGAVDGSVMLHGQPIDKAASYRIVTNNFLADGGDGFPAFTRGTLRYFGGLDIDAFADYLAANSPYTPGPLTRIIR